MTDLVNVKISAEGTGVDSDFGFRVKLEYDNLSRRRLTEMETFLMGAFGELVKVEAERSDTTDRPEVPTRPQEFIR